MKLIIATAVLSLSSLCWGWSCPTGQIRQQAPAGTPTTTPYYDVVEGIAFVCVPASPTAPTSISNTNTNSINAANTNTNSASSAANSNSTSTSSSNQQQRQQQGQSQNATATATGNGNGSNNSMSTTTVEAPKIPVNTAVAPPILPTVPCFKGVGGGVQTPMVGGSFGGGKVDTGCDDRELARAFSGPQTIASCKILISTKKAKKAGITMEDCLPKPVAIPAPVIQIQAPPQVIVIPTTSVIPVLAPPQYQTEITVRPPKKKAVRHLPPNCQNVVQRVCEK